MSHQNFRVFSPAEMKDFRKRYPSCGEPLPCSVQVGQSAKLWVWEGEAAYAVPQALDCVVVGVSFASANPGPGTRFCLAFEQPTGWWVVLENVRGYVTPAEVQSFDIEKDGLIEITKEIEVTLRRGAMSVIEGDRAEEQDKTPAKGAHLSLVNPPNAE